MQTYSNPNSVNTCTQVEKHWTEKSLEEMTERDWRIFREDFSISYKGTNTVLPMRNWDEVQLPKEIRKVGCGCVFECTHARGRTCSLVWRCLCCIRGSSLRKSLIVLCAAAS